MMAAANWVSRVSLALIVIGLASGLSGCSIAHSLVIPITSYAPNMEVEAAEHEAATRQAVFTCLGTIGFVQSDNPHILDDYRDWPDFDSYWVSYRDDMTWVIAVRVFERESEWNLSIYRRKGSPQEMSSSRAATLLEGCLAGKNVVVEHRQRRYLDMS
jgi:hypothetical protein